MVQQKTAGKIEIEKFVPHRAWRKYTTYLQGLHGEAKAGCLQRERQDLGHMTLLGFLDGVLLGSLAKARLVHSNQKEEGSKGCTGEGTRGRQRRMLLTGAAGEVMLGTYICLLVFSPYLGHALAGEASVSSRSLWPTWHPLGHTKWMPRQQ